MGTNQQRFTTSPAETLRAGKDFDLAALDPASTPGYRGDKRAAAAALAAGADKFSALQEQLFAASRFGGTDSLLLVLQAMDTAGKGGIVRHVVGSADPQGIHHHAFKRPTDAELQHDFLWRIEKEVPAHGIIGVFDRSHYEDVLVLRVHGSCPPEEIERRYTVINNFEQLLSDSGTRIIKVMLQISKAEQKERLMKRLDNPEKHWKYNPGDLAERADWDAYQQAYQTAIERTSTEAAPWYVVPANRKWYARLAVQQLLIDALEQMDLSWPKAQFDVEAEKKRLAES